LYPLEEPLEAALRVHGMNIAILRQLETNLRMPMSLDETEQTHATIRAQMKGQMGIWWTEAKVIFSGSFVREVNRLIEEDAQ